MATKQPPDPRVTALAIARGEAKLTDVPKDERPAVAKLLRHRGDLGVFAQQQQAGPFLGHPVKTRDVQAS